MWKPINIRNTWKPINTLSMTLYVFLSFIRHKKKDPNRSLPDKKRERVKVLHKDITSRHYYILFWINLPTIFGCNHAQSRRGKSNSPCCMVIVHFMVVSFMSVSALTSQPDTIQLIICGLSIAMGVSLS